jgi:hypothetical protein
VTTRDLNNPADETTRRAGCDSVRWPRPGVLPTVRAEVSVLRTNVSPALGADASHMDSA